MDGEPPRNHQANSVASGGYPGFATGCVAAAAGGGESPDINPREDIAINKKSSILRT